MAEGDPHRRQGLDPRPPALASAPVGGRQGIPDLGGPQLRGAADGAAGLHLESRLGQQGDGALQAVLEQALAEHGLPQLAEIIGARHGHQQPSPRPEHPPHLGRAQPGVYRQDQIERAIRPWEEAVGVGHDPGSLPVAPRREIGRRRGEIDPMRLDAGIAGERAYVVPLAAPHVEHRRATPKPERRDLLADRPQERLAIARVQKPPPRLHRLWRIARLFRPPVLWLQQVDVAAARDVERMPAGADPGAPPPLQGLAAMPDRADQGGHMDEPLLGWPVRSALRGLTPWPPLHSVERGNVTASTLPNLEDFALWALPLHEVERDRG